VQPGEVDFDHGHAFFRVQAEGDTAAVVFDAQRADGMQGDVDALGLCRSTAILSR
jgi:hypothetical protein